jgi:hypothetical protein
MMAVDVGLEYYPDKDREFPAPVVTCILFVMP